MNPPGQTRAREYQEDQIFKVRGGNLSAVSCDSVLRQFAEFAAHGRKDQNGRGDHIGLDLSELTFVDPYGMGMLCLIARYLNRTFRKVSCKVPDADSVRRYLSRMNVLDALGRFVSFEGSPIPVRHVVSREGLLEVTPINQQGDVESLLHLIGRRVSAILAEELNFRERDITGFKNVVAELCHNVLDHSCDWGYVAAQRFMDQRRGKKFAIIGVGDLGIGIRESLATRYDVSNWSHATAITNAVRKQFSRDPTRGLGLYVVNRICGIYGGSLHIRSGNARVYFRSRSVYRNEIASFPGTQISITLYQSDGGR